MGEAHDKRHDRKPDHSIKAVSAAIRKCHGLLAPAAELLGVNRSTVHRYVQRSATLQEVCASARDEILDLAESKLVKAINADDLDAIKFLLKTIGRQRGYVEKQEFEHSGNAGIETVVHFHLAKKRQ